MHASTEPKRIHDDMLHQVNMAILDWQNNKMSLKQLWRLPEPQFIASQRALTDFVEWSVNFCDDYNTVHGKGLRERNPSPMSTDVA
jgi:hypothetical protein